MTGREQLEYEETRTYVFNRAGARCEVCGRAIRWDTYQMAHRIPQDKRTVKRLGKKVIHHPLNFFATCSHRCNDMASLRNHPVQQAALIKSIEEEL